MEHGAVALDGVLETDRSDDAAVVAMSRNHESNGRLRLWSALFYHGGIGPHMGFVDAPSTQEALDGKLPPETIQAMSVFSSGWASSAKRRLG